jgi:hypothetical protein
MSAALLVTVAYISAAIAYFRVLNAQLQSSQHSSFSRYASGGGISSNRSDGRLTNLRSSYGFMVAEALGVCFSACLVSSVSIWVGSVLVIPVREAEASSAGRRYAPCSGGRQLECDSLQCCLLGILSLWLSRQLPDCLAAAQARRGVARLEQWSFGCVRALVAHAADQGSSRCQPVLR